MPISRGTVNHRVIDDLISTCKIFLQPSACKRPNKSRREEAERFVSEYFSMNNTVFFPYARTCLYALLKELRIPEGSEVLLTPFNISPMLQIIRSLRLKPAFIDINLHDFGPNYQCLDSALARKPACFFLTYLFGYVPNAQLIAELCNFHGVPLIEDISQSIGASSSNRLLGSFGLASIYSASITKYVDGYNGGFVLTNSDGLAAGIREFTSSFSPPSPKRLQGIILRTTIWNIALSRYVFSLFTYPFLCVLKFAARPTFDSLLGPSIKSEISAPLPDYYFEDISNIQLSTIISTLSSLGPLIRLRRYLAAKLINIIHANSADSFSKLLPRQSSEHAPTYWQFLLDVEDTAAVQDNLFKNGVETGITNLPNLAELCGVDLLNAKKLKKNYIFLPLHPHLKPADFSMILSAIDR